jgi:phosphatidylserine/phosphatidylglycerophosphate/cardiolipin synthase-like enzyme
VPELICALGPDNAGSILAGLIRRARATLDVGMYEVGPSYAWALGSAARRGVRVRVILDGHRADGNAGTAAAVAAAGGECRVLPRGVAAGHWKLLLVDGVQAAVGTGNLIWRDAPRDTHRRMPPASPLLRGTREWWTVTDDEGVAIAAAVAIEAAWSAAQRPPDGWRSARHVRQAPGAVGTPAPQVAALRIAPDAGRVRLVVGGLAVAVTLRAAIDGARTRVLITAPYVAGGAMAVRTLVAAARTARGRGVDTRLLLGTCPQPRAAAYLARAGVPARWMDPSASTRGHAKGVIVDSTALVTSANWSRAGLGANWEAALVMDSAPAAGYLAAAWERDWAAAQPVGSLV